MNHHVIDLGFVQVCAMAGMDTVQQLPRSGRGQKMEGEQRITLITRTRKGTRANSEPGRMGSSCWSWRCAWQNTLESFEKDSRKVLEGGIGAIRTMIG